MTDKRTAADADAALADPREDPFAVDDPFAVEEGAPDERLPAAPELAANGLASAATGPSLVALPAVPKPSAERKRERDRNRRRGVRRLSFEGVTADQVKTLELFARMHKMRVEDVLEREKNAFFEELEAKVTDFRRERERVEKAFEEKMRQLQKQREEALAELSDTYVAAGQSA